VSGEFGHGPPVTVGAYPTRSEAEIVRSLLGSAGITATVMPDGIGGEDPFDLSDGSQVLTAAGDADAAIAFLAANHPEC
jgi:hypothetical protein